MKCHDCGRRDVLLIYDEDNRFRCLDCYGRSGMWPVWMMLSVAGCMMIWALAVMGIAALCG